MVCFFFRCCNYLLTQTPPLILISFRRSRFNWPSEISDPYDEESTVASSPVYATPLKSKSGSKSKKNSPDSSYGELTHIRTIRVFEATKFDDRSFASLLFHHKTSPTS